MIKKACRLSEAAKCYKSSGGGDAASGVQMRVPSTENKTIGSWFDTQFGRFGDFIANNPLLAAAQKSAMGYSNMLPLMLQQFPEFKKQLQGYQGQLQGYQGQLGGLFDQLGQYGQQMGALMPQYQNLYGQLGGQASTLGQLLNGPNGPLGIAQSGGALSSGLLRNAQQQSLGLQSAAGTSRTSGGLAQTVLDSDAARQARYNTALAQSQGLLGQQGQVFGQQAGITGAESGLIGQQAGINQMQQGNLGVQAGLTAQQAGLTGQQAGLLSQEQALQTGGLNQLLGVGNAAVSQYTGLTNPILGYLSGLFSGNQQASIAQAQIAQSGQNASDSKKAGGTSAIGSIAGAAIIAL